ncbi:sulfate transporter CysZ [Methylomicrobium sp. Wu6]|uniref:sulfate transporter CysZ n=1 Tax=Methylomicrobium sp. Wu6 TaxID=3107928 RepID=UPI002DD6B528|nr:sulfate transporter CysZ [Methylomicrobium sp. Wu6]MEC4750400.1 sulfate transporter CysZ [Methylomicrobium sp. Wu6]
MVFDQKGNNPLLAIKSFIQGMSLLGEPKLRKFVLIPVLINFLVYGIAFTLGYYYLADMIDHFIPGWLQWLRWILWPLFFISFFIAGFFTFTVVANLIAAPFYGMLSAAALSIIGGESAMLVEVPWLKVIKAELKRAVYLGVRAIPLVILSIIPGINVLAPVLWALFGAWGMALEYLAYPLENAGVLFSEQHKLIRSVRWGALSFGGLAAAGLALPVINIIVAPAAVIGATIYLRKIVKADALR